MKSQNPPGQPADAQPDKRVASRGRQDYNPDGRKVS
jgi:hypothetical protein